MLMGGYSSNALQTFSFNLIIILSSFTFQGVYEWSVTTTRSLRRARPSLAGATGFTLCNVFSLWKGETELGLLTAGNGLWGVFRVGEGGSGAELRAGNDGSCSFLMSIQAKTGKNIYI